MYSGSKRSSVTRIPEPIAINKTSANEPVNVHEKKDTKTTAVFCREKITAIEPIIMPRINKTSILSQRISALNYTNEKQNNSND